MKKFLLFQLFCLFALTGNAINRTPAQMFSIAKQRLAHHNVVSKTRSANGDIKCILERPTLSVYGNGSKFVVVSRDNRFQPILAYGSGSFDLTEMPDGTKWWMDAIQESLSNYVYSAASAPSKVAAVAPLITTKWGQGAPYNNYAPLFKEDKTKAPAGCVATATAQVLNFNKYPASASFSGSYIIDGDTTKVVVNTTYNWPYKEAYGYYIPEGGTEILKSSYTPNQGNKVAELCRDCACSFDMTYSANGSGAYLEDGAWALIEKFGYPINATRFYCRAFYSEQEWMDIIYGELQKGYPFIYGGHGADGGSGHAFVADGMDEDGLLHINWGWYGQYDGYYDFRLLNPDNNDFSLGQNVVIGIRPEALEGDCYGSLVVTDNPFELSYDNTSKTLKIKSYDIYNYCGKPITGLVSILFENQTNIEKSDTLEFLGGETLPAFYGWAEDEDEIEWEFNPGEYKVYLVSQDEHETEYQIGRVEGVGTFYYNMTVDADKNVTIAEEPVYTGIEQTIFQPAGKRKNQYTNRMFDLQGRMVNNPDRKGLFIINGQKVLK